MGRELNPLELDDEIKGVIKALAVRVASGKYYWPLLIRLIRKEVVETCLEVSRGNKTKASKLMGVSMRNFWHYRYRGSTGKFGMSWLKKVQK